MVNTACAPLVLPLLASRMLWQSQPIDRELCGIISHNGVDLTRSIRTSCALPQALLAGFAWYGLTEVPFDEGANVYTQARAANCI
jgi:hypothetical protein